MNEMEERGVVEERAVVESSRTTPGNDAFAERVGAGVVVAAAVILGIVALRPSPVESEAPQALRDVGIPQPIEPLGPVDDPPTRFVWTPGGEDVDLSQVIVYGKDMQRIWATAPLDTNVATIPLDAYLGIGAGENCFWRVREVKDGKARAASGMRPFAFRRDLAGNVVELVNPLEP
jgi:hypothetical protein